MKDNNEKEYEMLRKVAGHIGDEKAASLSSSMKAIRDKAFAIMEEEGMSKDAKQKLKDLFVEQFKLGMATTTTFFSKKLGKEFKNQL